MPYVFVSTQTRLETGPCVVGDQWSDPELMFYLGAKLEKQLGNNFLEYRTEDTVRIILDKLELKGYRLISNTGVGQTCIWTLHRPLEETQTTAESSNQCDSSNGVGK